MKAVLIVVALLGSTVSAMAAPFKVNDRVVTTRSTMLTTPAIPGRTNAVRYAQLAPGTVLVVEKTEGDWLWVNDIQPGWVRSGDVATPQEARVIFSEWIAANRFFGDPYVFRGNVLLHLEEYENAHRDFAEAILREAHYLSAAYVGRAGAVAGLGAAGANLPQQADDLSKAVQIDRRNSQVLLAMAAASPEKRKAYVDEALRWNPLSARAWENRLDNSLVANDPSKALQYLAEIELLDQVLAREKQAQVFADQGLSELVRMSTGNVRVVMWGDLRQGTTEGISIAHAKPDDLVAYLQILNTQFHRYNDSALKKIGVRNIVLGSDLKSAASDLSGKFERDTWTIYLDFEPTLAYDRPRVVHHEMFHAMHSRLLATEKLEVTGWKNPKGFTYLGPERYKSAKLLDGFVSLYAMSSVEEDMAETFAYAATGGASEIWGKVTPDPTLCDKIRWVEDVVKKLDVNLDDVLLCSPSPAPHESGPADAPNSQ